MTAFDVYLNNKKLYRAGVGSDGVLNAIVSWVNLTGPARREAQRARRPATETRLHVGGLQGDTHRHWPECRLAIGDRITVEIVRAMTVDPPARTVARDPARQEREERRYYRRLKRRFEGPARQSSGQRRRRQDDGETRFLNVDLDIWSTQPLEPLVEAMGRRVMVLHVGQEGRRQGAHLELARSATGTTADQLIRGFIALVKQLPRTARASWNRANVRSFNVGVQSASRPFSFEVPLEARTLQAIASVNAQLVTTVYGAADDDRR